MIVKELPEKLTDIFKVFSNHPQYLALLQNLQFNEVQERVSYCNLFMDLFDKLFYIITTSKL